MIESPFVLLQVFGFAGWLALAALVVLVAYLVIRTGVRHGVRMALADDRRATEGPDGDGALPPASDR